MNPRATCTGPPGPAVQEGATSDGSQQANRPLTFGVGISFVSPVTDDKRCLELTAQLALIEAVGAGEQEGAGRWASVGVCALAGVQGRVPVCELRLALRGRAEWGRSRGRGEAALGVANRRLTAPFGGASGQCRRLAQAQACSTTPPSKFLFVPFFPQLRPLPKGLSLQASLLELSVGKQGGGNS